MAVLALSASLMVARSSIAQLIFKKPEPCALQGI
jgi:hypothetical protein